MLHVAMRGDWRPPIGWDVFWISSAGARDDAPIGALSSPASWPGACGRRKPGPSRFEWIDLLVPLDLSGFIFRKCLLGFGRVRRSLCWVKGFR